MQVARTEKGLYLGDVHSISDKTRFQIYRDGDWDQGIYPTSSTDRMDVRVKGADHRGFDKYWEISGAPGDKFHVEFRRRRNAEGEDSMSVSWKYVDSAPVDMRHAASSHKYYLVGSWLNFAEAEEMNKDEETGHFSRTVTISARDGKEQFRILLNNNWLTAVYPDRRDATPFDGHTLEGPDDGGAGTYWTIGLDARDYAFVRGSSCTIHLEVEGGKPRRVCWEKRHSGHPDAGAGDRGASGEGWGHNLFDRHRRLLRLEGP
jgi:hypothetical protein